MFRIENGIYKTKDSCTGTHKSITVRWVNKSLFTVKGGVNSIKISCTGSQKRFRLHYGLCLEMACRIFSVQLHVFSIALKFNILCDAYILV